MNMKTKLLPLPLNRSAAVSSSTSRSSPRTVERCGWFATQPRPARASTRTLLNGSMREGFCGILTLVLVLGITSTLLAQDETKAMATPSADDAAELAKKLSNPVAALISVPFQNNFDFGGGPNDDGFRYTLNFQPVAPFTLNEKWNLITRTIVPFIHQEDMIGNSSQTGLGDITQSFFFSPKEAGTGGWIWGVGPAFLYPSATDDLLGTEKFGLGPTAVFLKQEHGWTYGALVNHIWSVAGNDSRADVSSTFLQPFVSFTTKKQTTFTLNTESTYDWENSQWTVPVNAQVAQLLKIGKLPVQFQVGARYFAEGPSGSPEWGVRFAVVLLFPK
jgi:hypothetical protein